MPVTYQKVLNTSIKNKLDKALSICGLIKACLISMRRQTHGVAEKSHQQIGYTQVTNSFLSGTFVAFRLTFVARDGRSRVLVTGTQCYNVVSKK